MMVDSGRSALTFNAAISASSASTTIRSAVFSTLIPTMNCHDILASFNFTERGEEVTLTCIDRVLDQSYCFALVCPDAPPCLVYKRRRGRSWHEADDVEEARSGPLLTQSGHSGMMDGVKNFKQGRVTWPFTFHEVGSPQTQSRA